MITGMMSPSFACCWVCALNCLQNSMMFTPCWPSAGPTGGAGLAMPAVICSLMIAASFFFLGGISVSCARLLSPRANGGARVAVGPNGPSDLGDLAERQLDRGLPAEDRHQDLELLPVRVDLGDRRGQGLERAVHDGDRLADLEVHLDDRALGERGRGLAAGGRLGL